MQGGNVAKESDQLIHGHANEGDDRLWFALNTTPPGRSRSGAERIARTTRRLREMSEEMQRLESNLETEIKRRVDMNQQLQAWRPAMRGSCRPSRLSVSSQTAYRLKQRKHLERERSQTLLVSKW